MAPSGSTLRGRRPGAPDGLHLLAAQVLRGAPPGELAALLVPMVRRGLQTASGPTALVRWLRRHDAPPGATGRLTEDLVRALFEPLAAIGHTLPDSRRHEG